MLTSSHSLLSQEAQKLQVKVYNALIKKSSGLYAKNPKSKKAKLLGSLVQQLEMCSASNPCYGAACQNCLRRTAQMLKTAVTNRTRELKNSPVYQVTYINPGWAKPLGNLAAFDLDAARVGLNQHLGAKLPLSCIAVGGFDISHNLQLTSDEWLEHQQWGEHYQPHFQLLAWGTTSQALRDALPRVKSKLITGSASIRIERVRLDELEKAMNYAFKNNFFRRISCPNPHRSPPLVKALRGKEFNEVWSWLATKKTNDLLVIKGINSYSFGGLNPSFQ